MLPFLTNPTSCTGPVTTRLRANSWQNGVFEHRNSTTPVGADGCESVPFDPSVDVQSSATSSDTPTAISVDVNVPQPQNPTGVAESNLKTAEVTLPEGTTINPAAADGLAGCTQAQFGLNNTADPSARPPRRSATSRSPARCSPIRCRARSTSRPRTRTRSAILIAIYLVAQGGGVTVKLAGQIETDPATGQVTTTIDNAPQLPFSHFGLDFFGGERAVLATPQTCGTKTATAALSLVVAAEHADQPHDSFAITSGPNGSACASTAGHAPVYAQSRRGA